jgi:hypothetical protein
MNWLYHCKKPWRANGTTPAQQLLLRGFVQTDQENELEVTNIVELNLLALDFYFQLPDNPLADPKYQRIYFEELDKKDYFLEEYPIDERQDYMLKRAVLYLRQADFDLSGLLDWARTCLSIWGLPHDEFEEADMMSFSELDPILRMFSLENAKKFEDKLGKEWWKGDKGPKPE